jgi:HD-GYP domain-containing protein (c-di-GMP phosphodiesterase class II)
VTGPDRAHLRIAELLAALSLGIDLGFGQPMEHVLRQTLIATRLAERLDLSQEERVAVYYTGLLINVGCHSDAHEQAKWFGDDIALKATKYEFEFRSARGALATLQMLGSGRPPLARFRLILDFARSGHREVDGMIARHAAMARQLAEDLELPPAVAAALGGAYEQWDGRGWPGELRGEEVPLAARIAQLAEFVEVANRVAGLGEASALAARRSGAQFGPDVAAVFCAGAAEILGDLGELDTWEAVLACEPGFADVVAGERFDSTLGAVADFIDLKSPYTLGHSAALSPLAAAAATGIGMDVEQVRQVRRAALVAGFGRLGISNSILDKPGPLGASERERVRLQPYLTERMVGRSEALAPLGAIGVAMRERLDGSGYPRGLRGAAIPSAARLLGAADAYQAMREPRPHREALPAERAAAELRREVKASRLDADAVEAVLATAGHRASRRAPGPAGLTRREVDVLVLLARGLSNKEIAQRLVISPKTAGNHVEHIYGKIGVGNRVAAGLFAVRQGLLPATDPPA